jgi:hypothetical protein
MWVKALNFILGVPSRIKMWVIGGAGLATLFALFKLYIWGEKREAVQDFKDEKIVKDAKVRKDAKKVGVKEKRDADGLSDSDLADRLRGRSDDWDRL